MDLGFPTGQRRAALTSSGNVFFEIVTALLIAQIILPSVLPWAEGKANRGILKTPAWHCESGCDPIYRARRAQQSIPETPETGQSCCCRAGTANATWASSWQPKPRWEMGAGRQEWMVWLSRRDAGRNCPLPGFGDVQRGAGGRRSQAA